ncbi:hypothetical protein EB840_14185 [Klebsiella quasipneumoniae]|nr:hypothetical protein EB840_14185 [Klebsiella quasipneumoniae]
MMSLWDALRMNMMISYQELVRTFPKRKTTFKKNPEVRPFFVSIRCCIDFRGRWKRDTWC